MEKEDRAKDIYQMLRDLKNGSEEDKKLAFKCMGILSNESSSLSLDKRLDMVIDIINEKNKK